MLIKYDSMLLADILPLFIFGLRGWQLVIILIVIILLMVIPMLFGFVLGRRTRRDLRHRR